RMEISLESLKRTAALAGFAWTDAELEAIRPAVQRLLESLGELERLDLGAAEPATPYPGLLVGDLCWGSMADLGRMIATKQVSPVEVVRVHLDRIGALDRTLRAFITVCADGALGAARAAEADLMGGKAIGPLHSVPWAPKDLYSTKGVRTTGGSKILADSVPADHATVVARLARAGAILLGKLNMHEFAYGPEGINAHYGDTRNPWSVDAHRIAGGSSSGSGAAVAAGLAPGSLGSDTGGSIRIPASLCGITGLKPTYGRVSRAGVLPLAW